MSRFKVSKRRTSGNGRSQRAGETHLVELEFARGLQPFVRDEVATYSRVTVLSSTEESLTLRYSGDVRRLLALRRVTAVYLVIAFDVPRPKALLGDQHFRRLTAAIETVRGLSKEPFEGFRFGAAGSDSAVFERLAASIARATGMNYAPEEGELLLRVRPAREAWETLLRLTPRPLSARGWRRCNLPGGLNACVAAAMNDLVGNKPSARYLNAMCGTGTLLVERALSGSAARLVGCDLSSAALDCAEVNVKAAGLESRVELVQADVTALPFADASFDTVTADAPWGDAVGTHAENAALYPAFLREAARVAAPAASLVLLSHEVNLLARVLDQQSQWRLEREVRVAHSGHHPRIYHLQKV